MLVSENLIVNISIDLKLSKYYLVRLLKFIDTVR